MEKHSRIGHITLNVSDISEAVKIYEPLFASLGFLKKKSEK
jgi:catechol-2,3-dioxygenase